MHVHLQMTSLMLIGNWQNLQHLDSLEIYLDDELIKQVDSQKLLGISLDSTLNWDEQNSVVCLDLTCRISLLKQLSKYVNMESLKLYYNSYILQVFDNGCMIWCRTTVKNLNRMFKLQKRALRIILNVDYLITPSEEMFCKLQWLSFPQRINYHTSSMVYKTLNGLAPEYLKNLLTKTSEMYSRN